MQIIEKFKRDQRGSMVTDISKASLAIAFLSLIAANWLASGVTEVDKSNLSQLAASASKKNGVSYYDPTSTGTLQSRAASTKLDPCEAPARR